MSGPSESIKSMGFYLAGEWCNEGVPVEIHSPFDDSLAGMTFEASADHLERATEAAVETFKTTRRLAGYERQSALWRIAEGIAATKEDFARTMALEAGKPLKAARAEVDRAAFTFRVAAEECVRTGGEWIPLDWQSSTAGWSGLSRRFPLGPVAAITPFNFPLNLVAHKIAPAIASGCTVVLKPAPRTPLCALMLAELVEKSGWTRGALSVLPLSNPDAERMACDGRFRLLTFTGSAKVGWMLRERAGKKRVALELGGNAAVIICSDADVAFAAERCAVGGFSYAGQSCISVQRVFVHASIADDFLASLKNRVRALVVGDPLDEHTDLGPMINETAAQRAEAWIKEAIEGGAQIVTGGARRGAVLEPTVLTRTTPAMKVNCEEVFAPVVVVEPYDDFEEVLRKVNDTPYGLQAGLFTRDAQKIERAYETLEVGALIVNDVSAFRIDHMPYGGVKDSGTGREGLRYSIEEMTERKLLVTHWP